MKSPRIGIAGLGRVGRGILRANFMQIPNGKFDIGVACDVMPIDQVAYLLAHDTSYGRPPFSVDFQGSDLILGNKRIRYQRIDRRRQAEEENMAALREVGMDIFVDATGTATNDNLRNVINQKVAKKSICTFNVNGCDLSMVYGVNDDAFDNNQHHVISSSTCTGNAAVPLLHILNKHFGIDYARVLSIHPALSDQRALDGYHSTSHLGRACAASIIPTSTGVGSSIKLVLTDLEDKLEAHSYRVPTEIVSVIDMTATLSRETSRDECIDLFEKYARTSMNNILHCDYGAWGHQRASIDYLGMQYSAILLMKHLSVTNGRNIGLSLMHDNEAAYCRRVLDVIGVVGKAMGISSGADLTLVNTTTIDHLAIA